MSTSKTTTKTSKRAGNLFDIFGLGTGGTSANRKPTSRDLVSLGVDPGEFNPSWR